MTPAPEAASPRQYLALARAAETAGDLTLALAHCRAAVRGDPRHAKALVGIGLALYRQGRVGDAMGAFRNATEAQPGLADAWGNLAAMLGESGRVADALAALARALDLNPDLAELHALRGDLLRLGGEIDLSAESYARAARLRPDAPQLLNKLGCAQRQAGDFAAAEASLRRALELAPAFALARVNLGTLCVELRRQAEGRAELQQALSDPGLDADARREASAALAVMDEHVRLEPAIAEAVRREDHVLILRLLASAPDQSLPFDETLHAMFGNLATRVPTAAARPVARRLPARPSWPAIEAHFALHLGDEPEAIHRSVRYLAANTDDGSCATGSAVERDLRRYFRAVQCRRTAALPEGDGAAWEAFVRFWHAMLTWEHPELFPGQFKPTPNFVRRNPLALRARPEDVAGTIRRLFTGPYLDTPPGPGRAALAHFIISETHGFHDGNGRLARFLANFELERAGFQPIVLTDRMTRSVAAALVAVRVMNDLEPLVDLFARAGAQTTAILDRLGDDSATTHGPTSGAFG